MDRYSKIMKQGEKMYQIYARRKGYTCCNRRFAPPEAPFQPKYILVEDRFTTGHDDSATFVELIDENEDILISCKFEGPQIKRFENPDLYDDDCLVYYLRETLKLPVVQKT